MILKRRTTDSQSTTVRAPDTRNEWLLSLLFAPGAEGRSVCSGDHLMQSMYVLKRESEEKFELQFPFDFDSSKYGPVDESVREHLQRLREEGVVKIDDGEDTCCKPKMQSYGLTTQGATEARNVFDALDPEMKDLLEWVKTEHTQAPLGQLRSYIYSHYPETFD